MTEIYHMCLCKYFNKCNYVSSHVDLRCEHLAHTPVQPPSLYETSYLDLPLRERQGGLQASVRSMRRAVALLFHNGGGHVCFLRLVNSIS